MTKKIMHQEFYHEILNKIKSGELKNGEKLPTERAFCDIYDISRTTVREALKKLEYEGYVIRKQGSGNFVNIKPMQKKLTKLYTLREMFDEQEIKHEARLVDFTIITCTKALSDKMICAEGDEIIRIERLFLAANVPYTIETTYLKRSIFPDMTGEMIAKNGLYATMKDFGQKPTRAVETIRAINASAEQRRILELPNDVPAIEVERLTYSDDALVEYTINIIRNDYFIYTVELG